ncbi:MAG TPA: UvrD-helicase domain-containing protein [Micromonosporaceae bacterium]|nr:UvrD-helicase domain-containing protein [Micromonosporaceae bacterium]
MDPKSAELAQEQAYFDAAALHRERRREELGEAPMAAANPGTGARLRTWMKHRRQDARSPGDAVAFGRIDDRLDSPLYIGHEVITDEDRNILVISWKTRAAAPYYEASPDDPMGLVRRRTFTCDGNSIVDFTDVVFRQLVRDIAALDAPDPLLLSELDSARTGAMRDIVATIQAAQYELIRAPMDQVLVVEGGPGTGKTAVALHRVSWLLYNDGDRLGAADVLIVGPHPAFTRYVRTVLPDLGDIEVEHRDIGQLAPPVQRGRSEPPEVSRLKGDARMAGLLARAIEGRIGVPEAAERMLFDGRFVTLSGVDVATLVTACRHAGGPYATRRQLLRERLLDLARERGAPTDRARLDAVDDLVERLWPQFSTAAFLHGLLGSRARLTTAAGDEFTAGEVALLHRRGSDRLSSEVWSAADLALLDEVDDLIFGTDQRYRHIVVDEAQDLSPMQLRGIARRSATGSLTVVGDLAQSTGPWARDAWDDVLAHLPARQPQKTVALRYGYRVPRRVYDIAARLLPFAAPGVPPIRVVRDGPADPGIHRVTEAERAERAVSVAVARAAEGWFVGLICPTTCRQAVEQALAATEVVWGRGDRGELNASINLMEPQEAKGLEFDAVVVIEPEDIVAEAGYASDVQGHRMLFMALTRTTRYLDIVCVGEPLPLGVPEPKRRVEPAPFDTDQLDQLAKDVAAVVTGGAPPPLWDEVLQRAAALLERETERSRPTGRHRRD